MKKKIANILRKTGNTACDNKAETLENTSGELSSLHFRSLSLHSNQIIAIIDLLKEGTGNLKSISFSYNNSVGDIGAISLAEKLPDSVSEIGLVDCNISDIGGRELLKLAKKSPNLRMLCIEENNFSEALKREFRKFGSMNSGILVVV